MTKEEIARQRIAKLAAGGRVAFGDSLEIIAPRTTQLAAVPSKPPARRGMTLDEMIRAAKALGFDPVTTTVEAFFAKVNGGSSPTAASQSRTKKVSR